MARDCTTDLTSFCQDEVTRQTMACKAVFPTVSWTKALLVYCCICHYAGLNSRFCVLEAIISLKRKGVFAPVKIEKLSDWPTHATGLHVINTSKGRQMEKLMPSPESLRMSTPFGVWKILVMSYRSSLQVDPFVLVGQEVKCIFSEKRTLPFKSSHFSIFIMPRMTTTIYNFQLLTNCWSCHEFSLLHVITELTLSLHSVNSFSRPTTQRFLYQSVFILICVANFRQWI